MIGESEVLQTYRRAGSEARALLDRLLAPAGVAVTRVVPEGDGWTVHVVPRAPVTDVVQSSPGDRPRSAPGRPSTHGVEPLVRREGESLFALASRGGGELRVREDRGPGGICVPPLDAAERIRLLAGTLVGDTILALRHLGDAEDGPAAREEMDRQFTLFVEESARLGVVVDPVVFASAVEQWAPGMAAIGGAWSSFERGNHHA